MSMCVCVCVTFIVVFEPIRMVIGECATLRSFNLEAQNFCLTHKHNPPATPNSYPSNDAAAAAASTAAHDYYNNSNHKNGHNNGASRSPRPRRQALFCMKDVVALWSLLATRLHLFVHEAEK